MLLAPEDARKLIGKMGTATEAIVRADLGRRDVRAELDEETVRFPDGPPVSVDALRRMAREEDVLFLLDGKGLRKLSFFSEETGLPYRLRATSTWPALEIGGILMHRLKDTDPRRDAEAKLALVPAPSGPVLDTCCGLGYTAITAARTASSVTTFEIDPAVLEMARLNPFSRALFEDPRIRLLEESVREAAPRLDAGAFALIVHDPPTLARAGDLYAEAFYRELHRLLRPGGRLVHYVGAPGSRTGRRDVPAGVRRRLARAGFGGVRWDAATTCFAAVK